MAKKSAMKYAKFNVPTPKLEASFPSLDVHDEFSKRYQIKIIMDESSECQAMLEKLLNFQNECLEEDGKAPLDTLLGLKDEMSKNEKTEEWDIPTGRQFLVFHSKYEDKFSVVGPDKRPIDPASVNGRDTVRVNGKPAFGYMAGKPFVTLYLKAVQLISSGGPSGVDAFDDETGGETEGDVPFNDETSDTMADLV